MPPPPTTLLLPPPQHPARIPREDAPISDFGDGPITGNNCTDEELRIAYDDEEVERFLRLFSKHVTEVYLPAPSTPPSKPSTPGPPKRKITLLGGDLSDMLSDPEMMDEGFQADHSAEDEWVDMTSSVPARESSEKGEQPKFNPAAILASSIGPYLPPVPVRTSSPFTLASLRLAFQRLYIACYPTYVPLAKKLWRLSTWQEPLVSLAYCMLYFLLWWNNAILPCLILSILFTLFWRRLMPYPTVKELNRMRKRAEEAEELGNAVFDTSTITVLLSAAANENFRFSDGWKMFRNASKQRKERIQQKAAEMVNSSLQGDEVDDVEEVERLRKEALKQAKIDEKVRETEEDWKRICVVLMESIADLHERIKNIFIWRKPEASWKYGMILTGALFAVSVLPTRILSKLFYLVVGIVFWLNYTFLHRIPALLSDSLTDAEVATAIIAERTARGERVLPTQKYKIKEGDGVSARPTQVPSVGASMSTTTDGSVFVAVNPSSARPKDSAVSPSFDKFKSIVSGGIELADHGVKVIKGERRLGETPNVLSSLRHRSGSETSSQLGPTYLAECHGKVGAITLTSTKLEFASVGSSKPKAIELSAIRGIQKSGPFGGLTIKYEVDPSASSSTVSLLSTLGEKGLAEAKFGWVNGRDELFAKLVGWRSRI
ncbi:uncharacterized protein EI90DRAFT_3115677 [Cantharellus anzutake]|uniref:uncharacterized protein n=1 Tax=Cantharellus anzutake TaxID=1750568 RepID=UPI00190341B8|nr:uncharacterized protein EI90DRAFT_3115677 [Cantharellus anzutake]KAF8343157.1 hypothetical protein EI90DRAFT_3115677 [Cantharellus anzutake]